MKKKIVSLLTVMALAATTLAGCGSSSSDTAADTADSTDAAATEELVSFSCMMRTLLMT